MFFLFHIKKKIIFYQNFLYKENYCDAICCKQAKYIFYRRYKVQDQEISYKIKNMYTEFYI